VNAQEQVTSLAFRDTMQTLTKTLVDLAGQLGRPTGKRIEITAYLTQEELAQMVVKHPGLSRVPLWPAMQRFNRLDRMEVESNRNHSRILHNKMQFN